MPWAKRDSAKSTLVVLSDGRLAITMDADAAHPVGNTSSGTVILSEYHGDVPVAGGREDEHYAVHATVYHVKPSKRVNIGKPSAAGSVDSAALATMTAILQQLAAQNTAMAARLDAVESRKVTARKA